MGNIVVEGIAAGDDTGGDTGEDTGEDIGGDSRRGEAVGSLDS